ncbi:MAG: transcriptional regulator [Defluviitaleaceae bacterium]|nr:transcriptional regulator [Defluviitaleaceae bacterium]
MNKEIIRQAAEQHPTLVLQPFDAIMGMDGFDAIYTLCENIGGATVYIPSIKKIFAECMAREALKEFNGYNFDVLAKKYGFSHRHLRRLVDNKKASGG